MTSGIINPGNILLAVLLVLLVLFFAYAIKRRKSKAPKKRGQMLYFEAEGKTSAECRQALGKRDENDLFQYKLEGAQSGGWYLHFVRHNPTGQVLDTLFLLQFEGDSPARFSLKFIREAFGQREPIIPESLLTDFFRQKLGAEPAEPFEPL